MVKLSRLQLKNFKSLHDVDFELRDLNILIGRNGSGKSNLLSFFRLMQQGAMEKFEKTILEWGGFNEVMWKKETNKGFGSISIEIVYKDISIKELLNYYIVLHEMNNRNDFIVFEEGIISRKLNRSYYSFIGGVENEILDEYSQKMIEMPSKISNAELIIAQLRDPFRYPLLNNLRLDLSRWEIFRGFGENAFQNIYDSQMLNVVSPLRLEPDGSNLVSVLYAMSNESRYLSAYEALEATLRNAFPDFKRLLFSLTASGRAELRWLTNDGLDFPARSVSDGMLRFLGLATLLLLPDPPPLIAIDEPEIGLHPHLLPYLVELMKRASEKTQLIISTHSPLLISAASIEPEDVVIVESIEGETHLKRLSSTELKLWLERFTLGNLWTMGKFETA